MMSCSRMCVVAVLAGGCAAVPPPPIMPMHQGTEAEPRDQTSAMLVIGVVTAGKSILSGASGVGLAVRVEHQAYDDTALGVQLGGGRGWHGDYGYTLIALEGYGRTSLTDWSAATYGAGLSWFSTGLWTLSAHAGGAVSAPNDYVVPALQLGLAGVVPVVHGAAFGNRGDTSVRHPEVPTSELFVTADASAIVPIERNRASLDVGLAWALTNEQTILQLSAADAQHQ